MKLDNIVPGNDLIITQNNHGANQNMMAFDFGHLAGQAQADGKISKYVPLYNPKLDSKYPYRQSYFHFLMEAGNYIEYVHALSTKLLNAVYKRGQSLWNSKWHHVHAAIVVAGKWGVLLDYMRRDIALWWLKVGQKHPVWTNWSTYRDLHLPPLPNIITNEMVKLELNIKCKVISTEKLNVREQPNTTSKVVGQVNPGTVFETKEVASGTVVEGDATWYKYPPLNGWVSGKWVQELPQGDTAELEKQLAAEKAKNAALTTENTNLKTTNAAYKPGYDAAKLIQQVK